METQRRAAVALLAFVTVGGALALGVYAVGGQRPSTETIRSFKAGQQAFEAAQKALDAVTGPGIDLIADDPKRALELLSTAYAELDKAEQAGYPPAQIKPLRQTALDGLDRLYGMVNVASTDLFTFPEGEKPVSLTGLVRGPDGAPYVLDAAGKTVWRIDLAKKTATAVMKSGQKASRHEGRRPEASSPPARPDVLVLDSKNVLWRWRPANKQGKGTLGKVKVKGSASWGDDILDIATFVANFDAALYKLYIVDPSEQNIMVMPPRSDGSGYSGPAAAAASHGPPGGRDHRPVHRRRHLRRGERRGRPRDPGRGLEGGAARGHAAPARRPGTRCSRRRTGPTGRPAAGRGSSTPSTRRTTGWSRSTSPTGRTWRSTSWPASDDAWAGLMGMTVMDVPRRDGAAHAVVDLRHGRPRGVPGGVGRLSRLARRPRPRRAPRRRPLPPRPRSRPRSRPRPRSRDRGRRPVMPRR